MTAEALKRMVKAELSEIGRRLHSARRRSESQTASTSDIEGLKRAAKRAERDLDESGGGKLYP